MGETVAHLTHKSLAGIDIAIIAVYFVVIFAIGFYFARKERTSTDYFLASRDVGWFAIGASLFVSNISTEHFIGLAGSGASSGLAVGSFEWLACLILLILGWVFVPFYLRSNVFTMPEFLERRFSTNSRYVLSVVSLITFIVSKIAVGIFAGGVVFATGKPDRGLGLEKSLPILAEVRLSSLGPIQLNGRNRVNLSPSFCP